MIVKKKIILFGVLFFFSANVQGSVELPDSVLCEQLLVKVENRFCGVEELRFALNTIYGPNDTSLLDFPGRGTVNQKARVLLRAATFTWPQEHEKYKCEALFKLIKLVDLHYDEYFRKSNFLDTCPIAYEIMFNAYLEVIKALLVEFYAGSKNQILIKMYCEKAWNIARCYALDVDYYYLLFPIGIESDLGSLLGVVRNQDIDFNYYCGPVPEKEDFSYLLSVFLYSLAKSEDKKIQNERFIRLNKFIIDPENKVSLLNKLTVYGLAVRFFEPVTQAAILYSTVLDQLQLPGHITAFSAYIAKKGIDFVSE